MQKRTILVFSPPGGVGIETWEAWAAMMQRISTSIEPVLVYSRSPEDWQAALEARETDPSVLGGACALQDLDVYDAPAWYARIESLVQRGFPVFLASRTTLEAPPEKLQVLCERQWKLLQDEFKTRLT